ncbi:MAG: S-layer homology domain-containing protein [Clostridia bacterium]|nr:S-layer homology domain-containing protein [Clostridia bacterium]
MKNTVRVISFMLCLVILLGCITVQADDDYYQIKSDYVAKIETGCSIDEVFIKADYGNHSGYDIVVMGVTGRLVPDVTGSLLVGGITFSFGNEADIGSFYAYKDGEFIPVKDAFDAGLLSKADIYNIAVEKGDIKLPIYREIYSYGGITMTLEETTATLYISGEGRTDDYDPTYVVGGLGLENFSPVGLNSSIKRVVVEEGITYLGEFLFCECRGIEKIELPSTLEEIGDNCFDRCTNITHVVFPEGIKRIGDFCFEIDSLNTLTFYGNLPKSKEYPIFKFFEGTVYYPEDNPTWTEELKAKYKDIIWEAWSAPKIKKVSNRFEDVAKNAWYTDAVQYVYDTEMMIGTAPALFSPNSAMTRAQTVQILFNLSGEKKEEYEAKTYFDDVSENAWYTPAINWAYENRITSGVGFGTFAPNQLVTRGELVTFLLNYAETLGCTDIELADLKVYDDYREVGNWCYVGMAWAVHEGIISGMTETTLAPKANANRAQAARMLMKYRDYLDASIPVLSESLQRIADYVVEKGEHHGYWPNAYEYVIQEDGKWYMIEYHTYGAIEFSYYTSPGNSPSFGTNNFDEGLSVYMSGLSEEYDYYYFNHTNNYLITSKGAFTPDGFRENEFSNKREAPTDEAAQALRDDAMSELAGFIEKIMNELDMTTADIFIK